MRVAAERREQSRVVAIEGFVVARAPSQADLQSTAPATKSAVQGHKAPATKICTSRSKAWLYVDKRKRGPCAEKGRIGGLIWQ